MHQPSCFLHEVNFCTSELARGFDLIINCYMYINMYICTIVSNVPEDLNHHNKELIQHVVEQVTKMFQTFNPLHVPLGLHNLYLQCIFYICICVLKKND